MFERYTIFLKYSLLHTDIVGILIWLTCHVRNPQNAKLFTVFGNLLCGFPLDELPHDARRVAVNAVDAIIAIIFFMFIFKSLLLN